MCRSFSLFPPTQNNGDDRTVSFQFQKAAATPKGTCSIVLAFLKRNEI